MSMWKLFFSDNSFMSVQLGVGGQWILLSSTLKSSARGGGKGCWIPQEKKFMSVHRLSHLLLHCRHFDTLLYTYVLILRSDIDICISLPCKH